MSKERSWELTFAIDMWVRPNYGKVPLISKNLIIKQMAIEGLTIGQLNIQVWEIYQVNLGQKLKVATKSDQDKKKREENPTHINP